VTAWPSRCSAFREVGRQYGHFGIGQSIPYCLKTGYSDVVGLRAGAPVLGPPKHLIKQTLSKLFSRKILVGRNEVGQLGLSERLAPSIHCLHQPVGVDQQAVTRFKREFCLLIFLA
jgi:hypothetical protein